MNTKQLRELIKSIDLLDEFFKDRDKSCLWMCTKNPNLGEARPLDLFFRARGHKVLQFIEASIEENKPEEKK